MKLKEYMQRIQVFAAERVRDAPLIQFLQDRNLG
jgi:hypothetical protein